MSWTDWFNDPSGPGEVNEKTSQSSDGSKTTEYLRTEDDAKSGSRKEHSHVIHTEHSSGRSTAHGHGIFGGRRK